MYLKDGCRWVSGLIESVHHRFPVRDVYAHGVEVEGECWLGVDIVMNVFLSSLAVNAAKGTFQQARQGEFKRACKWGVITLASGAVAALNIYNTWSTIYASSLQCKESGVPK